MKKLLIGLPLISLLLVGCNQKEEPTIKSTVNNTEKFIHPETTLELNNTEKEITYPFKAVDGSRAIATLKNTDKENTIVILANRNMFQLDRKEFTTYGAIYERNGVAVEIKKDSLFITQGDIQIDLVLDK